MSEESFVKGIEGTLVSLEPVQDGYQARIFFPYFKELMEKVREGDLVCIENFLSGEETKRYTLLEVTRVMPKHYGLETTGKGGYPSFTFEAAKHASEDWTTQIRENIYQETYIECLAAPVGYDVLVDNQNNLAFQKVINKPMPGKAVFILNPKIIEKMYSQGLGEESVGVIGRLFRDPSVPIRIRYDRLIKYHFGIFGYTGCGKSNLVATIIHQILENDKKAKVVIFDVSGEYPGFLIDKLINEDSRIVFIDEEEFTKDPHELTYRIVIPLALEKLRNKYQEHLKTLVDNKRVKLLSGIAPPKFAILFESLRTRLEKAGAAAQNALDVMEMEFREYFDKDVTPELIKEVEERLDKLIKSREDVFTRYAEQAPSTFRILLAKCKQSQEIEGKKYTREDLISLQDLTNSLLDEKGPRLVIISSANVENAREFSFDLLSQMLYLRKRNPSISTFPILFVFDEAHEFIPRETRDSPGSDLSSRGVENLARQGRKYNMGVCIASQRVRYLNTSIIAQLHSYFVGTLPYSSDRSVIRESYNVDENILLQTIEFEAGTWLLNSTVATGMKNIPIVIQTDNAEERVLKFLKSNEGG